MSTLKICKELLDLDESARNEMHWRCHLAKLSQLYLKIKKNRCDGKEIDISLQKKKNVLNVFQLIVVV